MSVSRRSFLGSSAAAIVTAGAASRSRVWGANNRVGVCVVGVNGQGNSHVRDILQESESADIVALCDVDSDVLARRISEIESQTGKAPRGYRDVREALEDRSIDAITVATPNHWHSLMTVWGCQAGKDVYVEKPMSHNPFESRQVVAAARKYGRIVQHGSQSRGDAMLIRDMRLLRKGFIGKVSHSRGVVYKNGNRRAIGHGAAGPVPGNLDWNLWQGPAAEASFRVNKDRPEKPGLHIHYDWHWFWEYGNGEIGNQGIHEMDIACWGHNRGKPIKVSSTGGRYAWDDDGETPNTQATQFTYEDGSMMTFEVRNLGSFWEGGEEAGASTNSFFGETGYYVRRRGFFDYKQNPIQVEEPLPEQLSRFGRFFKAVRAQTQEHVSVSVEDAHVSCVHVQIGNAAYRTGHTLLFDPDSERFLNCSEANDMLTRDYREGFEMPQLTA